MSLTCGKSPFTEMSSKNASDTKELCQLEPSQCKDRRGPTGLVLPSMLDILNSAQNGEFFTCVNSNSKQMITEDKPKRTSICSNDSNDSSSCVALPTEDPQLLKVILAAIFIIIFVATGIVVFIWR